MTLPRCPVCREPVWSDTTWHGIAVLRCDGCQWREVIRGHQPTAADLPRDTAHAGHAKTTR